MLGDIVLRSPVPVHRPVIFPRESLRNIDFVASSLGTQTRRPLRDRGSAGAERQGGKDWSRYSDNSQRLAGFGIKGVTRLSARRENGPCARLNSACESAEWGDGRFPGPGAIYDDSWLISQDACPLSLSLLRSLKSKPVTFVFDLSSCRLTPVDGGTRRKWARFASIW